MRAKFTDHNNKIKKEKIEKKKIEKGKIEKGKIRNQVSITSSFGIHNSSFGIHNSSFGIQFSSLEIHFFQKIHMQTLDNSGTHDTSHKQTSRTLIRWDKLRCNCSSRKKKRCSSNLKMPFKIKNKNKIYKISFKMHFSSFGIQFSSFRIHFSSFGIHFLSFVTTFQKIYMQTSRTSIRCDKLRCNCSSKNEKRYSSKILTPLKIISKCKFFRKFSYITHTKILLSKKTLFPTERKSLMQKYFTILYYIISATKYTMSFSND